MSIQEAYNQWATSYDSDNKLTRDLDQYVTESTFSNSRYDLILEIGCGTGKNTAFLSQIAERVYAVDFSEKMLEKARAKLKCKNITFTIADITQPWSFINSVADLIIFNLILEHIADLAFVFSEAVNCLTKGGKLFICELHPFRQYQGGKAQFTKEQKTIEIPAYVHHLSDFLFTAKQCELTLVECKEWWHIRDQKMPPRLISFLFEK